VFVEGVVEVEEFFVDPSPERGAGFRRWMRRKSRGYFGRGRGARRRTWGPLTI